jgi:hypothetical protein
MSYNLEEFPMEPVTLYTITDMARALEISDATMHYWAAKGALPVPFAVTSISPSRKQHSRFWTQDQMDKICEDYEKCNGPFKNRYKHAIKAKPATEEGKLEVIKDEEDQNVCGMCGSPVFDMTMHIRFAHDGKYSAVGARQ